MRKQQIEQDGARDDALFLIGLSAWLARDASRGNVVARNVTAAATHKRGLNIPWFAFAFIGMVMLNSLSILPRNLVAAATELDTLLLAMAMAALGLTTQFSALRRAGLKPLLLGGVLFAWLIGGGAVVNSLVAAWLR